MSQDSARWQSRQRFPAQKIRALRSWLDSDWAWISLSALVALVFYLTTLQLQINGLAHPYTTDVGEIQNALPRWGTIHFTGYPQFTFLGSLFVTILRLVGIPPAAGASLFSALWGILSVGLLTALMIELRVPGPVAALASLLFALTTSMWIDASLAELHTMTMALTFGSFLMAVRFGRQGRSRDLYWLAFLAGQGVAHQRAFAFLAPALLVLVWRQLSVILRKLPQVILLGLLGPLTYLYLPLVDWLNSEWVFSAPGTWQGFWEIILDSKAERIVSIPAGWAGWRERALIIADLLNQDSSWWFWTCGLAALTLASYRLSRPERLGLGLLWIPYLLVGLIIWEGRVSDALLAVKLPVIAAAAIGFSLLGSQAWRRGRRWQYVVMLAGVAGVSWLAIEKRPEVVAITRGGDPTEVTELAERVPPAPDGRPVTLMAFWGEDYWQLAYAQRYQGYFPDLNLVDHNADFASIVERGDHLYTLSHSIHLCPVECWEEKVGSVYPTEVVPGVVDLSPSREVAEEAGAAEPFALGNGIVIREAAVRPAGSGQVLVEIAWEAQRKVDHDFSVAVHLVAQDPPAEPGHIIAQADSDHPVDGWYPTSQWASGEIVRDKYLLQVPGDATPLAVRIGMYRSTGEDSFENTRFLSIPFPTELVDPAE